MQIQKDETALLDDVDDTETEEEDANDKIQIEAPKEDTQPPCLPKRGCVILRYFLLLLSFALMFIFILAAIYRIAVHLPCSPNLKWWQKTIIYQVYPRSFQDSDGDGIGDLRGIENRLDHFHYINASAIWLNPIFRSPMKDYGYDVSNYTDIDPLFGNLTQFDSLLAAAHEKHIKIILDFVPNHSSNLHPWFIESRKDKTNVKRHWYVWEDPDAQTGGPPNNWQSVFGGSAWTYDDATQQYYLHQFLPEQPDLNFTNPDVVEAMNGVLRFWLDRGVDGFRVDAFGHLLEDPLLRNETVDGNVTSYGTMNHTYTQNLPGVHDIVRGWRSVVDGYSDRFIMGELYGDVDVVTSYYGDKDEFHFPLNFLLLEVKNFTGVRFNSTVSEWIDAKPSWGWPNWVIGNHDNPRVASRFGKDKMRVIYFVMMMLPGTITTYYGEEIGMNDTDIPKSNWLDKVGRDSERTPMQWNGSAINGGFSTVKPTWLPVNPNFQSVNVVTEKEQATSMLRMYRVLAQLRSNFTALRGDSYHPVFADESLYAFLRGKKYRDDDVHFLIVANLGLRSVSAGRLYQHRLLDPFKAAGSIVASAKMMKSVLVTDISKLNVPSNDGFVIRLEKK